MWPPHEDKVGRKIVGTRVPAIVAAFVASVALVASSSVYQRNDVLESQKCAGKRSR